MKSSSCQVNIQAPSLLGHYDWSSLARQVQAARGHLSLKAVTEMLDRVNPLIYFRKSCQVQPIGGTGTTGIGCT